MRIIMKSYGFILFLFLFSCAEKYTIHTITIKRTIRIPVQVINVSNSQDTTMENPGILSVTGGAAEELPLGPEGFDVLDDGGFVITDPLKKRIVFYESLGNYRDQLILNMAVNAVTLGYDSSLEVRKSNSGDIYVVDKNGLISLPENKTGLRSYETDKGIAKILEVNRGIISRPSNLDIKAPELEITFESDSAQMISLQHLETDSKANTYVALETTPGTDIITINKIIRKYGPDGNLISQIIDIPLDYYVYPTRGFRVKNGKVYQLYTRKEAVFINVWDMN
jgi:hypothetical protein